MNYKLGISTIYFVSQNFNYNGWEQIKQNLVKLNLQNLELNVDIPISWMENIEKDVNNKTIKILSMHNFCPAVENIPSGKTGFNVYNLNSEDEEERSLAIKYTLRTIDFAQRLNAEVVVLHTGNIPTEPTGWELYKFACKFGVNSKLYKKYKDSLLITRQKNKKKYFSLLLNSLDRIVWYAEKKNVVVGIETRFSADEIPNFEEVEEILSYYKTKYVRYWHDFGHAEILSKLGFVDGHQAYFNKYSEFIKGYHIHDVKVDDGKLVDHFAPGSGTIKFENFLKFSDDKIYILEIHPKEKFDNVISGVKIIKNILNNQQGES